MNKINLDELYWIHKNNEDDISYHILKLKGEVLGIMVGKPFDDYRVYQLLKGSRLLVDRPLPASRTILNGLCKEGVIKLSEDHKYFIFEYDDLSFRTAGVIRGFVGLQDRNKRTGFDKYTPPNETLILDINSLSEFEAIKRYLKIIGR